jgi:glycosyltransferase involved in cell wall biosynthesis
MQGQSVVGRSGPLPLVSVIIPTLNAVRTLDAALESLRAQTFPADRLEIVVVDGGSQDGTVELAKHAARADARIHVMVEPGLNTPAALNAGIGVSRGAIVWYIGGHGRADPRWVETAVADLEAEQNLGCVGGQIIPIGETLIARANNIARFSVFGVGRGIYSTSPTRRDVETVQWGAYPRDVLEQAGLFDPTLQFGEDEELNYRILGLRRRVLYDPVLRISYVARGTLRALFRQYRNYGRARFRVVRKHPSFLRPKHLAPPATVLGLLVALIGLILVPAWWPLFGAVIGAYAGFIIVASLVLARREAFPSPLHIGGALVALHAGYGLGMLMGVGDWVLRR